MRGASAEEGDSAERGVSAEEASAQRISWPTLGEEKGGAQWEDIGGKGAGKATHALERAQFSKSSQAGQRRATGERKMVNWRGKGRAGGGAREVQEKRKNERLAMGGALPLAVASTP
jgi:hypothetical protein